MLVKPRFNLTKRLSAISAEALHESITREGLCLAMKDHGLTCDTLIKRLKQGVLRQGRNEKGNTAARESLESMKILLEISGVLKEKGDTHIHIGERLRSMSDAELKNLVKDAHEMLVAEEKGEAPSGATGTGTIQSSAPCEPGRDGASGVSA